jgi:hypothetical protein
MSKKKLMSKRRFLIFFEELYFSRLADKRLKENKKWYSHEEVWAEQK